MKNKNVKVENALQRAEFSLKNYNNAEEKVNKKYSTKKEKK